MQEFTLDPRLEADSVPVTDLALSHVRLTRNAHFPWLLLVPRRPGLVELTDLARPERIALIDEIAAAGEALRATVPCDKLNVAALGNAVRQLHVHVVARTRDDAAWPHPVWVVERTRPYGAGEAEALASRIAARLKEPPRSPAAPD